MRILFVRKENNNFIQHVFSSVSVFDARSREYHTCVVLLTQEPLFGCLERHEGELLMTEFSFLGEQSL